MGNSNKIEIKNRKARFNYQLSNEEDAGLVLEHSEIKSIRQGNASIAEAYCHIDENNEVWIVGMHIAEFKEANQSHDPYRKRKLLLTKKQIRKFQKKLKDKGTTIIPKKLYINKKGYAKIEIAIGKGKKKVDKRNRILKKQLDRETKEKIDSLK